MALLCKINNLLFILTQSANEDIPRQYDFAKRFGQEGSEFWAGLA